jgi:hypothetical protein
VSFQPLPQNLAPLQLGRAVVADQIATLSVFIRKAAGLLAAPNNPV